MAYARWRSARDRRIELREKRCPSPGKTVLETTSQPSWETIGESGQGKSLREQKRCAAEASSSSGSRSQPLAPDPNGSDDVNREAVSTPNEHLAGKLVLSLPDSTSTLATDSKGPWLGPRD